MELVGILVIIVGFALKLDTIAVVVAAGLTTGLVAHMSIGDILNTLGEAFVTNRTTCLFMLTVPIIGLCERYGTFISAVSFDCDKNYGLIVLRPNHFGIVCDFATIYRC